MTLLAAVLMSLSAAALAVCGASLVRRQWLSEFRVELPLAFRCGHTIGRQIAPRISRLIERPFFKPLSQSLQRDLRLAGIAPALTQEDWLQIVTGTSLLAATILLLLRFAAGSLSLAVGTVVSFAVACIVAGFMTHQWLRGRRQTREAGLLRELPAGLELLALSLECGCALPPALDIVGRHLPAGALRDLLQGLHGDLAAGRSRAAALRRLFDNNQGSVIAPTLGALVQADAAGSSLAPVLRAQARQRTEERFAAAEKAALQAPVKMLLPLISCIFPCTFVVIAFPLVNRFIH